MARLPVVLVLVSVVLAPAARAATCAKIGAGTPVYSKPSDDARVGAATGEVVGIVVERGAWVTLKVESFRDQGDLRLSDSNVTVVVPGKAARPARCPRPANAGELTLLSELLALRWADGRRAGSTRTSSAVGDAARSKERVELDGKSHVCFDREVVPRLKVHVCGSCETLRSSPAAGDIFEPNPGKPCE